MAMATCRECTREISTDADRCPGCGALVPTGEAGARLRSVLAGQAWVLGLGALVLVALGAVFLVNWLQDRDADRERAQDNACYLEAAAEDLNPGTTPYRDFIDECLARQ